MVGIGGKGTLKTDALIYAMKVEETPSYSKFKKSHPTRASYLSGHGILPEAPVLVSRQFFYFGNQAPVLPPELSHIVHPTQGCKRLSDNDVALLNKFLLASLKPGKYGKPNNMQSDSGCGPC